MAPGRIGHLVQFVLSEHPDRAIEDVPEAVIYRTEVLSIIGALADIVVDLRAIREELVEDGEEEEW
jgi:hypothetical protein